MSTILRQITSDRIYLWQVATTGIQRRPHLGWGFDGFGIAYPHVEHQDKVNSVLELGQLSFAFLRPDGAPEVAPLPSNKAHNLFLDTALSVGIWGMLAYVLLLGMGFWGAMRSPYRGIEAIAIVYLVFTFTWFECAQFTHLVWWGLSCVPASRKVGYDRI